MPIKISDLTELSTFILSKNPKIIGIDGQDGVGKTTLVSEHLKQLFNARIIHLDDYLVKKIGTYFNALKYKELIKDIG